jgi:hypothetical protein
MQNERVVRFDPSLLATHQRSVVAGSCGSTVALAKLQEETVELEDAVEMAIEACGGNPRSAIRALLRANTCLNHEVERLRTLVSPGFARGKLAN